MSNLRLKPRVLPHLLLLFAILGYALTFSYLTLTRYAAFEARALDMGNLDQAIWNTAHGHWFHLTNQPGTVNRLSLHVEPILLPIALLYWLHSGPPILLILQAMVVALGAWPLFALAQYRLNNGWLALALALTFLLHPAMQAANWLEFHPLTLAPTFLLAAFYFLLTGQTRWYALFAVLAASCKEEIALLIFMIGLYAWVMLRRRRLGSITMGLCLLWALIAVFGIQNAFAAGNIHWSRYDYLGSTPTQKVWSLLTKPALIVAQLGKAQALNYLAQLLLPVAFTALCGPELLLLALPSLGINLLADFPPMHQVTGLIYAAPIVPFVMIAAVEGVSRLSSLVSRLPYAISLLSAKSLLALLIFGSALYAQARAGYLPGGGNYQLFTVTDHHWRAASIIAQIPATAKVTAQDKLNPHVSGRETIYIFPRVDDADTVWVDVTGPAWPQHPNDLRQSIMGLLANGFGIAAADDGYLLLRQGATAQVLPDTFFTAWRQPDFIPSVPRQIDFADTVRLLDYRVETDGHGELVTKLYWTALKPIGQDLRFYVGYWDAEWNVLHDTQFYPPAAQLWYPTNQWTPSVSVLVQTFPWTLAAEQFALVVGVYTDQDGWSTGKRLPITQVAPSLPRLDSNTGVRLGGYQRGSDGMWAAIPFPGAPPELPLAVQFGAQIRLEGVTIPTAAAQAGHPWPFVLTWRAHQPPVFDYNVFAHLVDANGNKVAQLDWQPHDAIGKLPATAWIVDQPVVDTQTLLLPDQLAPGEYRLLVGLYNWQDGQRLPVSGAGIAPGDSVTIAQILVK